MEDNRLFYDMSLESIPYYYNLHIQEMNYEFIESLYNKGLLELNESNIEYIHEAVADWYNKWRRATVTIIKSTVKQFSNYAMTVDMKYKPFLDENRDLFFKQTSYKNKSQISIKGKSYPELSAAIKRIGIPLTQSINGIDLNRVEVGNTDGGSKNMWLKRLLIPSYNGAGSFAKFAKDYFYGSDTKESLSGNRIQQVLPLAYNFCYNMNRTVRILKDEGNAIASFIDKDPVTGERGHTTKSEVDLNKLQDKLPNMKASTNPYQNTPNLNKPTTEAVTSPNVPSASNSMNSPNVDSATITQGGSLQQGKSTTNSPKETTDKSSDNNDRGNIPQVKVDDKTAATLKKQQVACNIMKDAFNAKATAIGMIYRDCLQLLQTHVMNVKGINPNNNTIKQNTKK